MLNINRERFLGLMQEQARIGGTPEGGLNRPALSEADIQIRQWYQEQIEAHDLEYAIDSAGNQTATYRASAADAKTLIIGSHFDSVPNGGRFDGALGVLAAFEAVLTLKDNAVDLPFHVEVMNFTDEEGTHLGLLGSSALTGTLHEDAFKTPRSGREMFEAGLERAGLTEAGLVNAGRDPDTLLGYIEVHIEQGTRLESSNTDIGIVPSIVGINSYWLTFIGEAAHAGTQPIPLRRDAMLGASAFALRARDMIHSEFDPGVVNVGQALIAPGAFNIVPAEAKIALEFRHGDMVQFDAMERRLMELAEAIADEYKLGLVVEPAHKVMPAPMSERFIKAMSDACERLDLSYSQMMSFAGHDAQTMAKVTDSVMYFVPSLDGISHNPKEFTRDEDCVNAANVMLHAVLQLAEELI